MNKMQVCFVNHVAEIGGGEVSLLNLLKTLDRERFSPVLVCPSDGRLVDAVQKQSIPVYYMPIQGFYYHTARLHLETLFKFMSFFRTKRFDLIHANSYIAGSCVGIPAKLNTIPLLTHIRDLIPYEWAGRRAGRIHRFELERSTYLIAISHAVTERLVQCGLPRRKIVPINNGVDVHQFHPAIDGTPFRHEIGVERDELLVGVVGQIIPWKGHREFIQAASQVVKEVPRVRFVIVGHAAFGDADFIHEIRNLSVQLGISDRVIITGYREDIPIVMAALDLLVLASWAEPFGRVLIEAGSTGKPVVATRAAGALEVVQEGETGLLVEPRNPRQLAEAMIQLLRDTELRLRMGRYARQFVTDNFNLQDTTSGIQELYMKVLHHGRDLS